MRPRPAPLRPGRASPAASAAAPVAVPSTDAVDRLLSEVAAAAMLVARGTAVRVVVCNAPATIDFDELRLIADRFDVRVEPIVRVGGGGLDLAVASGAASHG